MIASENFPSDNGESKVAFAGNGVKLQKAKEYFNQGEYKQAIDILAKIRERPGVADELTAAKYELAVSNIGDVTRRRFAPPPHSNIYFA